ncbi:hypothetical protein AVEN_230278-1 [Araneus ventricosus]|uniref:Uncharacterized protein n=1 Tax=Araneus ventricosus TaxID=182803 RepID=A0A4Y2L817_ARAVE|nr:hypothetical protein AVEN_230278-1 [Araneus ventricosus]
MKVAEPRHRGQRSHLTPLSRAYCFLGRKDIMSLSSRQGNTHRKLFEHLQNVKPSIEFEAKLKHVKKGKRDKPRAKPYLAQHTSKEKKPSRTSSTSQWAFQYKTLQE